MEKVGEKGTADMLSDEQKKTNEAIWAELKELRRFHGSYNKVCDQRDAMREERNQALNELDKALFDLGRARSMIKSLRRRLAEAKGKSVEFEEDE